VSAALIVDDSRAQRMLLGRLLADLGFESTGAGDGRAALAALESEGPFAVALVDWNMPVMDGLSFIRAVRENAANERLLLVMVTSESEPTHIARALMAGADEYLVKPVTTEALQAKLELAGLEVGC
jgi:two-component system, chemotaxis family, chemotaxis protein CheY